jgi:hypothetical protein
MECLICSSNFHSEEDLQNHLWKDENMALHTGRKVITYLLALQTRIDSLEKNANR